jgi:hypothetical protein
VKTRTVVGLGALACLPCCAGPIVAALGAIAALGLASTLLIGAAGLVIAATAIVAAIFVRRRAGATRGTMTDDSGAPVAVELFGAPR